MKSKYKIENFIDPQVIEALQNLNQSFKEASENFQKLKGEIEHEPINKKSLFERMTLIQMAFFYIGCHLIGFGLAALILKLFGAF